MSMHKHHPVNTPHERILEEFCAFEHQWKELFLTKGHQESFINYLNIKITDLKRDLNWLCQISEDQKQGKYHR